MMHKKFFFSVALLLSISVLPAMESDASKPILPTGEPSLPFEDDDNSGDENSFYGSYKKINLVDDSILKNNCEESELSRKRSLPTHELSEIEIARFMHAPDPLEFKRQTIIEKFNQIEWLANSCKTFYKDKQDSEETRYVVPTMISGMSNLLTKLMLEIKPH